MSNTSLERVIRKVSLGEHQQALDLLRKMGDAAAVRNARGVCLMRLRRFDDALGVLGALVLKPGCTWVRAELPTIYKANYATALMLSGHPSGALEVLAEIRDETHASVRQLRAAIKKWESGLPFWQKLNWRFGRIEPADCAVDIDFLPGEFEIEVTSEDVSGPETDSVPPPRQTTMQVNLRSQPASVEIRQSAGRNKQ